MQRRIAGTLVGVVGIVLITVTTVANLFSVAPAFEDLSDDFRPVMTQATIDQARADLELLGDAPVQFGTDALPFFAQALGMTPEQAQAFIGESFPEVAAGLEAMPAIKARFDAVIGMLDAERERFASADAIPTSSIPASTMPWTLVGTGMLILLIGAAIAFTRVRWVPAVAVVIGLALIAVPLFLSLPGKAGDADLMNEHLQPVYTQAMVDDAGTALGVLGTMGRVMNEEMIPALAQQLQMTPQEVGAALAEHLPAFVEFPDALGRFTGLIGVFGANLANYDEIKSASFVPIVWTIIGAGIAMALVSLIGFGGARPAVAGLEKPAVVRHVKAA